MSIVNGDLNGAWVGRASVDAERWGHRDDAGSKRFFSGSYILILTGAVIVAALAVQGFLLWQSRQEAWNSAVRSGENLLNTFSASVEQSLNAVELSLNNVRSALEIVDIDGLSARQQEQLLFERTAPSDLVSSIFVMSRRGDILAEANAANPQASNQGDRDYFLAHIRRNVGTYVSQPFRDRAHGGEPSVAMSQRVPDADGSFNGVVVATLRLSYFRSLFGNVKLGPNSIVSLAETGGAMLMRWPSTDGEGNIGMDLNRLPAFERMLTSSDHFVSRANIDGQQRLYIFTQVGSFPLLLTIAFGMDDIYADWTQHAIFSGTLTLAFCIALGCLARALQLGLARSAHMEQLLKTLSLTDPLTGLPNRRAFDERFDSELRRMAREGTEMALLLLDVDHFRAINEGYGHPAGDKFLLMLGQQMRRSAMRPADMVVRFGEEAFAVLLPSTDLKGAMHIAERIRSDVERTSVALDSGLRVGTTVSVGVVTAQPALRTTPEELLKLAGAALEEAKAKGRNKVIWRENPVEAAARQAEPQASDATPHDAP